MKEMKEKVDAKKCDDDLFRGSSARVCCDFFLHFIFLQNDISKGKSNNKQNNVFLLLLSSLLVESFLVDNKNHRWRVKALFRLANLYSLASDKLCCLND